MVNLYGSENTYQGTSGKNFSSLFAIFMEIYSWNIGFVTSPETSQKTGVPGKTVITFSYRLQMQWDHFHWKEYGL